MPMIRASADFRNRYVEISEYCHTHNESVFITRNGSGDLAVMRIELYEQLMSRQELYEAVDSGIDDGLAGRAVAKDEAFQGLRGPVSG